jgi:hypothetical protein
VRLITLLATVLALLVGIAARAHAECLPQWDIDYSVFHAELVILASFTENRGVQVKEVFMGEATVGQRLQVDGLGFLPRRKFDSVEQAVASGRGSRPGDTEEPASKVSGDVLLILEKDAGGHWGPYGEGSGVKWLADGKVFGYQQLRNPGDYFLLPDREVKTEAELRKEIQKAAARKSMFVAARSVKSPEERVKALAEFIQPEEKGARYSAALEEITKAGPTGCAFLRQQVDSPEQKPRRGEILRALMHSGDPEGVPYWLAMVKRAAPLIKAKGDLRQRALSEEEQVALGDWGTAIYALAEMTDKRAVPAFREALVWGAGNWNESRILEYAARGLQKLPSPDNIPPLAQALSSIPPGEYDWVAVYDCLLALREHRYKEAVPVLAPQLKWPDNPKPGNDPKEYNARVAHGALVAIVGKDLGKDPAPWIAWFEAQQK